MGNPSAVLESTATLPLPENNHHNTNHENFEDDMPRKSCSTRACNFAKSRWNEFRTVRHVHQFYEHMMYKIFEMDYLSLFLVFTMTFYILTIIFSILIVLIGLGLGKCIQVGDADFNQLRTNGFGAMFSGAFALSWTTFSTVGYGNTWPSLSDEIDDDEGFMGCTFFNLFLIFEAFLGVCFSGACGAILFTKVSEISYKAQITFSHPMTVRFGSGIVFDDGKDDDESVPENDDFDKGKGTGYPCPVLEFRILNKLYDMPNGVITDATISCAVGLKEDQGALATMEYSESETTRRVVLPRKIFRNVDIVNDCHPFFKRCWTAAHILNQHSPLLIPKMRKRIERNGGLWPEKYNQAELINQCINFEEIIVSFNGISKHTSCGVNAQKVYDRCDLVIGYDFVDILEKTDGEVIVKVDMLNDVVEQDGADEPLPIGSDSDSSDSEN